MKEYTVDIGGLEHTLLLTPEDAERMGAKAASTPDTKAKTPANKSRDAANKS